MMASPVSQSHKANKKYLDLWSLIGLVCMLIPAAPAIAQITDYTKPVQYYERPAAKTVEERIDRLIWGITLEIDAPYDQYGHEIRRLSHDVGDGLMIIDPQSRARSLQNLQQAYAILKQWQDDTWKEMFEIREALNKNPSPELQTRFETNQKITEQFFVTSDRWIVANGQYLEFLTRHVGRYKYEPGRFQTPSENIRRGFLGRMDTRNKTREKLKSYPPFKDIWF